CAFAASRRAFSAASCASMSRRFQSAMPVRTKLIPAPATSARPAAFGGPFDSPSGKTSATPEPRGAEAARALVEPTEERLELAEARPQVARLPDGVGELRDGAVRVGVERLELALDVLELRREDPLARASFFEELAQLRLGRRLPVEDGAQALLQCGFESVCHRRAEGADAGSLVELLQRALEL